MSRDISTPDKERKMSVPEVIDKLPKEIINNRDRAKSEGPPKTNDIQESLGKLEHK